MCSRFHLLKKHLREVYQRLGIPETRPDAARFNIGPMTGVVAVKTDLQGAKKVGELRWGLPAAWGKGAPIINARAETVAEKPAFRDAVRHRRCVVPASGYYEWEKFGSARKPWLFRRKDQDVFGFAAIWSEVDDDTVACAVLTTAANEAMASVHDRMPVTLAPERWDAWLDPATSDPAALRPLLDPPAAGEWERYRVTPKVGNVRFEDPACIAPYEESDEDEKGPQLSLGF
ncbi:MAG: SOS response-associated peptidase [Opitutus sp.]|nr:SOS response-associated peptidase [Opitutus sp.]